MFDKYSELTPINDSNKNLKLSEEEIYYVPLSNSTDRINLNVLYENREEAKYYGAQWDPYVKSWYFEADTGDLKNLKKYMPKKNQKKKFRRTVNENFMTPLTPQQIFDIQKLLQLTNPEFSDFLFIDEEDLVKAKSGETYLSDEATRTIYVIKNFCNHYRTASLEEIYTMFKIESYFE